jgi:uncharacterized protein YcbX
MDGAVGRVQQLFVHPVKSMAGVRVEAAEIGPLGLDGDRRWAVRDLGSGKLLSAKREPRLLEAVVTLEGGAPAVTVPGHATLTGDGADEALTQWLGRPVCLVAAEAGRREPFEYDMGTGEAYEGGEIIDLRTPPGTFHDSRPVHLLTTGALAAAGAAHPSGAWDVRRFRPNVLIETPGGEAVEDGWVGTVVTIGDVELEVVKRTGRCVVTTRAQPGLPADRDVLRTLSDRRGGDLGIYAVVRRPGRVEVGQSVSVA